MCRLTKVDDLIRHEHAHLRDDDECYFLREYTAYEGYEYSSTNSLIYNLKKKPDRRGLPEWKYKARAIRTAARELCESLNPKWLNLATLVPMPPSKSRDDPLYDDRVLQVLRVMDTDASFDIRDMLAVRRSVEPSHMVAERPPPQDLQRNFVIDGNLVRPEPKAIGLVDDVLTSGAHFRAAKQLLIVTFPNIAVIGLFIARRCVPVADV